MRIYHSIYYCGHLLLVLFTGQERTICSAALRVSSSLRLSDSNVCCGHRSSDVFGIWKSGSALWRASEEVDKHVEQSGLARPCLPEQHNVVIGCQASQQLHH